MAPEAGAPAAPTRDDRRATERVRRLEKESLAHLRAPEHRERLLDWAS